MAWHGQGKETWLLVQRGPTWSGVMVWHGKRCLIDPINYFVLIIIFVQIFPNGHEESSLKTNRFNTNRHVDICDRYFHPWWKCNLCDILGESATHPPASIYCLWPLQCTSKWAIWLFGAKYPQLWGKTFEMQKQQIGGDTLGKIIQCATLFNSHWEPLWHIKSNSIQNNEIQKYRCLIWDKKSNRKIACRKMKYRNLIWDIKSNGMQKNEIQKSTLRQKIKYQHLFWNVLNR